MFYLWSHLPEENCKCDGSPAASLSLCRMCRGSWLRYQGLCIGTYAQTFTANPWRFCLLAPRARGEVFSQLLIIGIYYEWAMGHPPPSKLTKTSPTKIPEIILFKVGCTYPVNARGPIVDSQISARFFGPGTKTGAWYTVFRCSLPKQCASLGVKFSGKTEGENCNEQF